MTQCCVLPTLRRPVMPACVDKVRYHHCTYASLKVYTRQWRWCDGQLQAPTGQPALLQLLKEVGAQAMGSGREGQPARDGHDVLPAGVAAARAGMRHVGISGWTGRTMATRHNPLPLSASATTTR